MNLWKVLDLFRSFFKGEEVVSAAPPVAEPVLETECESQMADEHDRSKKIEDLNLEDWPLEDSFKLVSDFLDSMPGNSRVTEPEMNLRASSPSSVSSSRMSFLHETSFQTCQGVNQKLETLEQQMDELSIFLTQSDLRREKLLGASAIAVDECSSTLRKCHYQNCGTRILSANAVLEAETAPTPNILQNHLSTTPMDSVCNSHFPGTKSPLSNSKLLPDLLKESIVPRSAKHGLQNIILANPLIFARTLPGGSAKTRQAGHRRGRPPRFPCEHSLQTALLSFYDGRLRGRPPRSAAETFLLSWSHQPKGHRRGRLPNNYPRSCSRPNLSFCILGIGHYFCLISAILISRRVLND